MNLKSLYTKSALAVTFHFFSYYITFDSLTQITGSPLLSTRYAIILVIITQAVFLYTSYKVYKDPDLNSFHYSKLGSLIGLLGGGLYIAAMRMFSLGRIHISLGGALFFTGASFLIVLGMLYQLNFLKETRIRFIND